MNLWFLVWIFLSVFICGIFFWSLEILFKQKKTWADFAKKHGLEIANPGMLKSPMINGLYKKLPLQIFSEPQSTPDQRGRRFRTIIQFELPQGMPTEGIVASRHYHPFAHSLSDLPHRYTPDVQGGWSADVLILTKNIEALKPYFTPARLNTLSNLMTTKTFNSVLIFDLNSTILRIETPDPLYQMDKMEKLVAKIEECVRTLSPK